MKKKGKLILQGMLGGMLLLCGIFFFLFFRAEKENSAINQTSGQDVSQSTTVFAKDGEIQINNILLGEIHFLECYLDNKEYRPIVIIQHGLTGKKEEMLEFGKEFARRGYYVIIPDAYGHGESGEQEPLSVIEMAIKTGESFDIILKNYDGHELADNSRLGITGMSMGGFSAFYYAVNGKYKTTVLGSMYSTPDWEKLIGGDVLYVDRNVSTEIPMLEEKDRNEIDALIKEKTPYKYKNILEQIPMLLINGELDPIIPLNSIQPFYEELHKTAADMRLQVIKKQGHELTVENLYSVIEFFQQYLK